TDFSIEETSILGDQSIISDLLGSETVSTPPEEVEEIKDEPEKKEEKPKKETKVEKKEEEPKLDEEGNPIKSFLEEEEEEEDDTKKTEKKEEKEEKEPAPTNKYSALAKDLLKLGVFSQDEEEDDIEVNTPEEFLERFKYEGE